MATSGNSGHSGRNTPEKIVPLAFISEPVQKKPRKRLFIGLVTGLCFFTSIVLIAGWAVPYIGFSNIHASVPYISGIVFSIVVGSIIWAALSLVIQIMTGKSLWGASRMRGMTIKFFLPLMEILGRLFGIQIDEVRRSFIKVNNELTLVHGHKIEPSRLLILLPHCLQHADCAHRLSYRIEACERCGRCSLAGLLNLRDQYGVQLAVATGGTIARRIVVQAKPKLIVAVACERDLTSGIQDSYPLPVFGILNARPEGPCFNTKVTLPLVENALRYFLSGEVNAA